MHKPVITRELFAWFIVITLIIIIIGELPSWVYDSLATPRVTIGNFKLDWWHVSHFWFYMVVGIVCPGNFWTYTLVGTLFELGESGIGAIGLHMNMDRAKHQQDKFYWFGRWEDVVVNALGYLIGEWSATGSVDLSFP
jgi:hypothetical protein